MIIQNNLKRLSLFHCKEKMVFHYLQLAF